MKNKMRFEHIANTVVSAKFSPDKIYRYQLSVSKGGDDLNNGKTVCVIMQNPSVANEDVADKSIKFLERLIFEKDSPEFADVKTILIVNQFAFVQTNDFIGNEKLIGTQNDFWIEQSVDQADIVIIAWGKGNSYQYRQEAIQKIIQSKGKKIVYTASKHPSRASYAGFLNSAG